MPSIICRQSTKTGCCTLESYNAGKDRFRAVAQGLPCPSPFRTFCCSKSYPQWQEIDKKIVAILDKYNIPWRGISIYWKYQIGHYGNGKDTWDISCIGNDTTHFKSAALEVEQLVISAGVPKEEVHVELSNVERLYNHEPYCIPDDQSLMATIIDIQPKVVKAVREHIPKIWTSIAYHMRGRRGCEEHEKKSTIIIFCKPNSQQDWLKIEAAIAADLRSNEHSDVVLHLEFLPGQVERATPSQITHKNDFFPDPHRRGPPGNLTEKPRNGVSIGLQAEHKPSTSGALGGWVGIQMPDGRYGKYILTTYDLVRNGSRARRALNDYNAPRDTDATREFLERMTGEKTDVRVEEERRLLRLVDQLNKEGIRYVVHASGQRVAANSNKTLDWALIDSPSTFQQNLAPYRHSPDYLTVSLTVSELLYNVRKGDFIKEISSYQPGDQVAKNGRCPISQGQVNRFPRRIRWDDGSETCEDEVLGDRSPFAYRGDIGSWILLTDS
ncbi:uncharacterized protein LY89DRAFT_668724 [Mollisia scopiformis]|uniref:Uncharacterized protein n=1 Tax=Mollisia scopiformis TaxID=149040 RepID=A0A194XB47_MOLSC|nr:uncharacterized protein LY89DRAFT_668724 [Mollisia scopiformis]KUJ17396.1 hypothetical protein LY89DRAFT_668724 [Mollisia scopiformis]